MNNETTLKDVFKLYIDLIGEDYTDFVNNNIAKLEYLYSKISKKRKKEVLFANFCYLIYRESKFDNLKIENVCE